MKDIRIGQGYDVHRLVQGRKLMLGGVELASDFGFDGHSDADVLLHAVCDALLGALALGDIGFHFPNTDEAWRGADSARLTEHVMKLVQNQGYTVGNLDCSLCLEKPKILPYLPEIRTRIASLLQVGLEDISVKATTSEKLGYVGQGEGGWAMATVLLFKV